jgi:hypothetical protein
MVTLGRSTPRWGVALLACLSMACAAVLFLTASPRAVSLDSYAPPMVEPATAGGEGEGGGGVGQGAGGGGGGAAPVEGVRKIDNGEDWIPFGYARDEAHITEGDQVCLSSLLPLFDHLSTSAHPSHFKQISSC